MPFVKGQVANPKGRGATKCHEKRLAATLLGPHKEAAVQVIAELLGSQNPFEATQRLAAAKLVLEYTLGKPQQQVEVSGEEGGPIRLIIKDA